MNYKKLPILKTERLILRPVTMNDAEDIFAYASDPEVSKFLEWGPSKEIEETRRIITDWLLSYEENKTAPWIIVDKMSDKVIGTIEVRPSTDNKQWKVYLGY